MSTKRFVKDGKVRNVEHIPTGSVYPSMVTAAENHDYSRQVISDHCYRHTDDKRVFRFENEEKFTFAIVGNENNKENRKMNKPKINKVSKEKLGAVKKERNTNTTRGALFSEFDDLKPGGDAVEVSIVTEDGETDKQLLQYIRSLASMYTRNETSSKRLATNTNSDKTMAYIYAEEV